jgi:probable HAF family extracellular repeat protein
MLFAFRAGGICTYSHEFIRWWQEPFLPAFTYLKQKKFNGRINAGCRILIAISMKNLAHTKSSASLTHIVVLALTITPLLVLASPVKAQTEYTFTTLNNPLAAKNDTITGINSNGMFFGTYEDSSNISHSYLSNGETYTPFDHPLGVNGTFITDINNVGNTIGYYLDADNTSHNFWYEGNAFRTLAVPDAISTSLVAMNNTGMLVGNYTDSNNKSHPFVYNNGNFTTLDAPLDIPPYYPPATKPKSDVVTDINDTGSVIGYATTPYSGQKGFLYKDGNYTKIDVKEATNYYPNYGTQPRIIKNNGMVLGSYQRGYAFSFGFLYTDGQYTTLKHPFAGQNYESVDGTWVNGMNEDGTVIGRYAKTVYYPDYQFTEDNFVYKDGKYTSLQAPGATKTSLNGISDNGTIFGRYTDSNNTSHNFLAKPTNNIPEPTTLTLVALGGLGLLVRRKYARL